MPSFISPLIVTKQDIKIFRPIYLDIADYGIELFDKDGSLQGSEAERTVERLMPKTEKIVALCKKEVGR
ncbi:MAG: hypothetical protein QW292_01165 [Candidatus Parvarchaeota archaeon]